MRGNSRRPSRRSRLFSTRCSQRIRPWRRSCASAHRDSLSFRLAQRRRRPSCFSLRQVGHPLPRNDDPDLCTLHRPRPSGSRSPPASPPHGTPPRPAAGAGVSRNRSPSARCRKVVGYRQPRQTRPAAKREQLRVAQRQRHPDGGATRSGSASSVTDCVGGVTAVGTLSAVHWNRMCEWRTRERATGCSGVALVGRPA